MVEPSDVFKAIAAILDDRLGEFDRDARAIMQNNLATLRDDVEQRVELSRLNNELWREQKRREIDQVSDVARELDQIAVELDAQRSQAQDQLEQLKASLDQAKALRWEHLGGYKAGKAYRVGDIVMRDRGSFVCVSPTDEDPRDHKASSAWRQLAAQGERGPRGERGERGPRGEKGEPGLAGTDGIGVLSAALVGTDLALALSDGSVQRIDMSGLLDGIDARIDAAIKRALEKRGPDRR